MARRTVDEELDRAREELRALGELGIDLDAVTDRLQVEGVEKFAKSFRELIDCVEEKLGKMAGRV